MTRARPNRAAERSCLYGLLSTVFRRPFDASKLARFRSPEMLAALAAAGVDLGEDFATADADELLDRLAIDYTGLFHGPRDRISLHESVHVDADGDLMGASARAIRRFMAENGFEMVEAGELPDHLSVELALMGTLAEREAIAIAAGNTSMALKAASLQRRLMEDHLTRWATTIADMVSARAQTRFYAAMADLLADFIATERAEMERAA